MIVDGIKCNEMVFNVIPLIISVEPRIVSVGDIVTIIGNGFASARGTSQVSFNGINALEYLAWNYTEIKVKVPIGATNGMVVVITNGLKSNGLEINVLIPGEMTDIEGNKYKTIQIGTQVWMAENLNVKRYRNGDPIAQVRDSDQWVNLTTGAWCYYNNDAENGTVYGKLYNWYSVNDPRGLAPKGWHVPSEEEWWELFKLVGSLCGKLKEVGTAHWPSPNSDATNETGFSGLPGGARVYSGSFNGIGNYGKWWTFKEGGDDILAKMIGLSYSSPCVLYGGENKYAGLSIRCLRD